MTNTIEKIANSSEVSKIVFKALSDKQRARRATDLTNLYRIVLETDQTVQEKEVLAVFKKLQDDKVGSLVIGRRNKHNRFLWNYNLKQVALAAQGKIDVSEVNPINSTAKKIRRARKFSIVKPSILKKKAKKAVDTTVVAAPEMSESVQEQVAAAPKSSSLQSASIKFTFELPAETPSRDIASLVEIIQSLQKK